MSEVSAIIPTRDRPGVLADCLSTLEDQEVQDDFLEVIVIDDGSEGDMSWVQSRFGGGGFSLVYERQQASGLNAARNTGVSFAKSDILAFLDDDTLVSPGWAQGVYKAFHDWKCDGMAGRIELRLEGSEPNWLTPSLRAYLSEFEFGLESRWLDADLVPYGANCAVSRAGFEKVGGFRPGLDRIGESLVSNGDIEFFRKLKALGGSLVYWPEAHVLHRVPENRLNLEWFKRRAFAQGWSDALLDRRDAGFKAITREIVRMGRAAPILALNFIQGRGGAGASIWVMYCRGRMAGLRGEAAA